MMVMTEVIFWVLTPCSVVVGYQHFRGPCCLHHPASASNFAKLLHKQFKQ